jgi:hypothetical protein
MMPVVRINDGTFANMAAISTWFGTKTPSETIDRIVLEVMDSLGLARDGDAVHETESNDRALEFEKAPGLGYTKLMGATVAGNLVEDPYWKTALLAVIAKVKAQGLTAERLVEELNIPALPNKFQERGFEYAENLGISVQGQSATSAWKEMERLAAKWHIPVTVEFKWYHSPKAQFPGKLGRLHAGS